MPKEKKTVIPDENETYYLIGDVEKLLKASNSTVKRWIRSGRLHAVKFGDDVKGVPWRITAKALEDFKKKNAKYNHAPKATS